MVHTNIRDIKDLVCKVCPLDSHKKQYTAAPIQCHSATIQGLHELCRFPWSYPRPTRARSRIVLGSGEWGGGEPGNLNSKCSPAESARWPKLVPAAFKHFQSSREDFAVFPPQSPLHLSAPAQDGGTSSQPVGHLRPAKSPGLLLPRQLQAELETRHISNRLI